MADVKTIVEEVKKHAQHNNTNNIATTLKEVLVLSPGVEKNKLAVAATDDHAELSFTELVGEIQAFTNAIIASGVQKGDVISVILPNGLAFLVSFLGVTWARAIAAPLNSAYTLDEFVFYLDDIKAKAVIVAPGEHPAKEAAKKLNIAIWEIKPSEDPK